MTNDSIHLTGRSPDGLTAEELRALDQLRLSGYGGTMYAVLHAGARVDDSGVFADKAEAFEVAVESDGVVVERTPPSDWRISEG